ncbi:MAG: hypothetical protein OER56_13055 [Hyphomicrobiales bacterium]|nr:hypothetical protein [Hyphomicrobiales bacterium]
MTQSTVRPGRPVYLELNAQRVTCAFRFYQELFAWTLSPLHVPPWGNIAVMSNGDRDFGTQFMAMGAFATPRWIIWFTADLERAEAVINKRGGDVGQGIHQLGPSMMILNARGPLGHPFSLARLDPDPPEVDACGDPHTAEFWGSDTAALADFYADVLDLKVVSTTKGAMLTDGDAPRLFLRNAETDMRPRWLPYFRTSSVGGDCERARRAGGIVQVHQEVIPDLGDLVVLADPAGAYFGLINPDAR